MPEDHWRGQPEDLRRDAEARVDGLSATTAAASPVPEDIAAIVHELRVHQVELEMQNEELRRAQLELDEQREEYFRLFNGAPVGYLTVSDKGIVTDANLTAADLLHMDRQRLVGQPLSAFVLALDRDAYYLHTHALWKTRVRQTWELRLRRGGGAAGAEAPGHFWARFEALPQDGADGESPSCWMTFSDIDESVAAREALQDSRERLREAHGLAHIGVWEWDTATDIVTWTEELYRIAGRDPGLPAPTYAEQATLYTAESWGRLQAAVDRALETGEPYRLELELVRPDGTTRWVNAFGGGSPDDDGRGVRLGGTVQDITESRRAGEQLRESEEKFRALAEAVPQIVWTTGPDGKNTYFNQQWVDYTGLTLEESHGDGWSIPFHPDDRQRAWDAWQRATAGDAEYSLECRLRRADGAYRWWLIRGAPQRDESGAIIKWFGTCTDIEEIKLAGERLRRSERNLAEAERIGGTGSWDYDVTSDTASWSENMFRIFDVDPTMPTELVFTHFVENLVHPADRPHVLSVFRDALAGERPYDLEYRVVKKDGSIRDIHAVAEVARDDHGNALRMVGWVEDITERKQGEDEVRRLNAELEQRVAARTADLEAVNKELEAFVYSAAHDLRAPLRAIDGFSQMVVEDAAERLEEGDVEHLQRVRVAAERMGELIDHLIELSRTARADLVSERVDLSAVAAAVLADLHRSAPEREVEAVVRPGLMVTADATLVEVVLVNLLSNAWKYTSKHATAHIEVGVTDGGGGSVFFVSDDGVGFDSGTADHLFGAFQRFHSPEEFPGDGIGLATVQRLVTKHGGRVWAESEVGKGATFFFTLPPAPAD